MFKLLLFYKKLIVYIYSKFYTCKKYFLLNKFTLNWLSELDNCRSIVEYNLKKNVCFCPIRNVIP